MNVCTRAEAEARANVKKFEPLHGWGSDKRPDEMLTTGELLSLVNWLRERNARLSSAALDAGRCRFNCRTAREVFDLGVVCGRHGTDPDKVWRKCNDRKGKRATSAKDNQSGV